MKGKNRYYYHAHISEKDFKRLLREFVRDCTATACSQRTRISRQTVSTLYRLFRERLFILAQKEAQTMDGEIEIDESYFGPRRVRGKRGRGASHKIPVFGLLKRDGRVYAEIVKNCSKEQLLPILKGKILTGERVYTDGWPVYDSLVYNYDHYRVYHSQNEFARGKNHINGIESFWSWSKRRLSKFNGITQETFYLHLKECEYRFNHRDDDLYHILLKEFRKNPLRKMG